MPENINSYCGRESEKPFNTWTIRYPYDYSRGFPIPRPYSMRGMPGVRIIEDLPQKIYGFSALAGPRDEEGARSSQRGVVARGWKLRTAPRWHEYPGTCHPERGCDA